MASKKKLLTSGIALTLAAAIGLGGTFAWQSINQTALNEASDIVNPGGRLHNDQHWVSDLVNDTDIYVENFTDPDNGGNDIFARVRLEEYMEVVMNYGVAGAETVEVIAGSKTPVEDSSYTADNATRKNEFTYEYAVHKFTDDDKTNDFWTWTAGDTDSEDAYFIPTYNLNKDSLLADLNGEYVDTLGGISNREAAQYEYTAVTDESTASGYEVYDGDVNTADEVEMANLKDLIENGADAENYATFKDNIVLSDEKVTHNAAKIGDSNGLISMSDWFALNDGTYSADTHGNYWVYDTDGWVYWSSPIKAGETTGRLLDSISLNHVMDDTWYYAINVVAQFVTANDVGKANKTGFYDTTAGTDPSEDAETLLKNIGVDMPESDDNGDNGDETETDYTMTMYSAAELTTHEIPYLAVETGKTIRLQDKNGDAPVSLAVLTEAPVAEIVAITDYTYENGVLTLGSSAANSTGTLVSVMGYMTEDAADNEIDEELPEGADPSDYVVCQFVVNDDGKLEFFAETEDNQYRVDVTVAKVGEEIPVTLAATGAALQSSLINDNSNVGWDIQPNGDVEFESDPTSEDVSYENGKLTFKNPDYAGYLWLVQYHNDDELDEDSPSLRTYVYLEAADGGEDEPVGTGLRVNRAFGASDVGRNGEMFAFQVYYNDAEVKGSDVSKLSAKDKDGNDVKVEQYSNYSSSGAVKAVCIRVPDFASAGEGRTSSPIESGGTKYEVEIVLTYTDGDVTDTTEFTAVWEKHVLTLKKGVDAASNCTFYTEGRGSAYIEVEDNVFDLFGGQTTNSDGTGEAVKSMVYTIDGTEYAKSDWEYYEYSDPNCARYYIGTSGNKRALEVNFKDKIINVEGNKAGMTDTITVTDEDGNTYTGQLTAILPNTIGGLDG